MEHSYTEKTSDGTNRDYSFLVSVVMAVYNVEPFLSEAIDSLISQSIGFENIQLIMTDDGSTDGSRAICDEYASRYPDNIKVIHKENGGVSSARNEGIKYAEGRYLNFMDADDKLDTQTIEKVIRFFSLHESETDVVAIPLTFFDGASGEHMLNYKFDDGSRVINLYEEYDKPQLSMASAFFAASALSDLHFDERLENAEDAKCLIKILLKKSSLGVLKEDNAQYLYRKRSLGESSAVQKSGTRYPYYLPYMHYFVGDSIDYCLKTSGYVPKFVQYILAYDLQWRIKLSSITTGVLTETEEHEYLETIADSLKHIDDDVIMDQKHIGQEYKLHMLRLKYGHAPEKIICEDDVILRYGSTDAAKLSGRRINLEFLKLNENEAAIEGFITLFPDICDSIGIDVEVNGRLYHTEAVDRTEESFSLGESILKRYGFKVSIPLHREDEYYRINFLIAAYGAAAESHGLEFKQFFPLTDTYSSSCCIKDGWKVTAFRNALYISSCGRRGRIQSEFKFLTELWKKNRLGSRKAIVTRLLYHIFRLFKHKPIWLISDRIIKADDNGEALFRYICEHHKDDVKAYFVISRDSVDWERMSSIGPTINALSHKHKLMHLLCDCNISSQADGITVIPFPGYHDAYRDILSHVHFVFLQHGITKDDISGWLNRYNKDISGFVTAANPEYDSIINGNYHYSPERIWKTGFPRYDRLEDHAGKIITIMPTWREYLMGRVDSTTGIWTLKPGFELSRFYSFYNGLINAPRLLEAAKELGYRIKFLPHPTLQPHIDMFTENAQVELLDMKSSYSKIYAESSLVITDYSSAVFDFSYLRKPIVYCHFDAEEFFAGEHVYTKGYFDYERDGFGEVEYDLDSTVDLIIEYMENGCKLKYKYRERIDKFFAYNDRNNCQRVYDKIMELENR